jgi:hypothetical protein
MNRILEFGAAVNQGAAVAEELPQAFGIFIRQPDFRNFYINLIIRP